jgi:hypothetical protein
MGCVINFRKTPPETRFSHDFAPFISTPSETISRFLIFRKEKFRERDQSGRLANRLSAQLLARLTPIFLCGAFANFDVKLCISKARLSKFQN